MTQEIHDQLTEVLIESVRIITDGEHSTPRPQQAQLAHRVLDVMLAATDQNAPDMQVACQAPTGLGKSLAYLAPAMLVYAVNADRTVISTESLMLQDQILEKDAPVVAAAVQKVTGVRTQFALLKGWSNYVCERDALSAALGWLGAAEKSTKGQTQGQSADAGAAMLAVHEHLMSHPGPGQVPTDASLRELYVLASTGPTDGWVPKIGGPEDFAVFGRITRPVRSLVALWSFALNGGAAKRDFRGDLEGNVWSTVSTSTDDCSSKKCPFYEHCAPKVARSSVNDADIIVTNHAYLAVQAATCAPVILGNSRIGQIDHLVMDEAHGITGNVRSSATITLSGRTWGMLVKRVGDVILSPTIQSQGLSLGDALENRITRRSMAGKGSSSRDIAIAPTDVILDEDFVDQMKTWIKKASRSIPEVDPHHPAKRQRDVMRAKSACAKMLECLGSTGEVDSNIARWINPEYNEINFSPVDVASMLAGNVYQVKDTVRISEARDEADFDEDMGIDPDREQEAKAEDGEKMAVSVTAVSATLPRTFTRDAGMRVRVDSLTSPFDKEFAASMAFVPMPSPDEDALLVSNKWGRKALDTTMHHQWCIPLVVALVRANGGSALVLSATKNDAIDFANHLTDSNLGFVIHSQFGGLGSAGAIAAWKEDHNSVLVGTRSLMTGVDAPGTTNSLVIIDRVPRDAQSILDDARVTHLINTSSMNKWSATNSVYAVDAQLRLEQAVGRLIRRFGDLGAVALLDPRMNKLWRYPYSAATWEIYREPLAKFGQKTISTAQALAWLRNNSASHSLATSSTKESL